MLLLCYYHARAGELQERAAGRPTRLHRLLFWLSYGSPCQHCVNMASPHPKGLLSLRVAQISRQKRPLLAAKGHVLVGGHLLGRRGRECRRPGWSWLVAGWRWWPWQARCIREEVLEGCRDRHAVVPCKALLAGIHLDIENKRLLREPSASTLALPETLGERLNDQTGRYVEATLGPPRGLAPGQSACASRPHRGLALDKA